MNSPNKYTGPILAWPDPNTLIQLCEKQGIQAINIPNYNQNNSILGVQSNSLPVRIIPNMYLPSTSQPENNKSELDTRTEAETKISTMVLFSSAGYVGYIYGFKIVMYNFLARISSSTSATKCHG